MLQFFIQAVENRILNGSNPPSISLVCKWQNLKFYALPPFSSKYSTETARKFQIENKIHIAVRDNAANMGSAMRVGNFASLGCTAHTVQLIIHSVFKDEETTKDRCPL